MSRIYEALKLAGAERRAPSVPKAGPLPAMDERLSDRAQEAYQRIGNAVLATRRPGTCGVILVASAVRGEGVSTISRNLARILSQEQTTRVLLMDANLRAPSQHTAFGVDRGSGLSDVLGQSVPLDFALSKIVSPGLTLMTSGGEVDTSPAVLRSAGLRETVEQLRSMFDWIVMDGPAVTVYSDASVLAGLADEAVLVVRAEGTRWEVAEQAKRALESSGLHVLGSVLNRRRYHIPKVLYERL